jgi:hypothetical protein
MKPPLRTKSVGTKVSEAEYALLEERARGAGMRLAEWVREALLAAPVESGVDSGQVALGEILALRSLLRRGPRSPTPSKQKRFAGDPGLPPHRNKSVSPGTPVSHPIETEAFRRGPRSPTPSKQKRFAGDPGLAFSRTWTNSVPGRVAGCTRHVRAGCDPPLA